MSKYNPENERVKRDYVSHMRLAQGKQDATVVAALAAIDRFQKSTGHRSFKAFHIEQAKAFREKIASQPGARGQERLSAATMTSTLRNLKTFFTWLAERAGYKSRINFSHAEYFNPTAAHARIASARRESRVPTIEQFDAVVGKMAAQTLIESRNRAVVAFLILSGARDGSIPSFKLRHLDLVDRTVFHDARSIRTKGAKTFVSVLFPVGDQFVTVLRDYVSRLKAELLFGPDDPLFPAPQMGHGDNCSFCVVGLSRRHWNNASPIRRIVRDAFEAAGFGYPNPHSVRKALARFGEQKVRTPEEWKAWSQNLGHENEMTTFRGYGEGSTAAPKGDHAGVRGGSCRGCSRRADRQTGADCFGLTINSALIVYFRSLCEWSARTQRSGITLHALRSAGSSYATTSPPLPPMILRPIWFAAS
jgi:site-specific recombinase XerD